MTLYNNISTSNEFTITEKYEPTEHQITGALDELVIEDNLIKQLQSLGYEYRPDIRNETNLMNNLKVQIEKLNNISFNDVEWNKFSRKYFINTSRAEKIGNLQEEIGVEFAFDNNTTKTIKFIDKEDIYRNHLQVINQFVHKKSIKHNRYDVSILVNGLPLVHLELKKQVVPLTDAFEQINDYNKTTFAGSLFNYINLFIISNYTYTKYYANQIRNTDSCNFEYTHFLTDRKNKPIINLTDFADNFLNKGTILNVLTKYIVLKQGKQADEANNKYINRNLIVMRPYQITAVEESLRRLNCWNQPKPLFNKGGYIWHSTGSGKTLTSFKLSTLIAKDKRFDNIDKILFVVDRQDLDFQTHKEFDKFQKDSVQDSKNTKDLIKKLESDNNKDRVIITTIQKLGRVVKEKYDFKNKKFVFIFDECHRSQFGETHTQINKYFKDNLMFGFTGTPIIADKEIDDSTERLFGDCLHSYKINDAIKSNNVLGFNIQYIKGSGFSGIAETVDEKDVIEGKARIDFQLPYKSPERIKNNAELIIRELPRYTQNGKFSAMFAVHSIDRLKQYYDEFKRQNHDLKIGAIYSTSSADVMNLTTGNLDDENNEDASGLDINYREYLENVIIKDFNDLYNDSCSVFNFKNYSQKLQSKINEDDKSKRLDLVIVVNMFLTGFDAPCLNTLIIDKKLKKHGLIQAISRTNRIYNEAKTQGNILVIDVSFGEEMEKAFDLYTSDTTYIFTRTFPDYYELGYFGKDNSFHKPYIQLANELLENYNLKETNFLELSDNEKIKFLNLFNQFAKIRHFLKQFGEFDESMQIINQFEYSDYVSHCQMVRRSLQKLKDNKEVVEYDISNDLTYHSEIYDTEIYGIDKVISDMDKAVKTGELTEDKIYEFRVRIGATNEPISKKELLEEFLLRASGDITENDDSFTIQEYSFEKFNQEVRLLVRTHDVVEKEIREYLKHTLQTSNLSFLGRTIPDLIKSPLNRFGNQNTNEKIESLKEDLKKIYERFHGSLIDYNDICLEEYLGFDEEY